MRGLSGKSRSTKVKTPLILVLLGAVGVALEAAGAPEADRTGNPAGLQIVTLRPDVDPDSFIGEQGFKPRRIYHHALHGFAAPLTPQDVSRLRKDKRILAVEPDAIVALCDQTVPAGIVRMNLTNFPVAHIDGGDHRIAVDVAVLDSGIQTNHPDLNVVQAIGFTASGTNGDDAYGHGTHVAGIIGALDNSFGVVGVAPGARLWAVRVFDGTTSDWSTILDGMDYIAANADEIAVVNASFSSDGQSASPVQAIEQAVSNIVAQGTVFVAAAGNGQRDLSGNDFTWDTADDVVPAGLREVMAVSAMDPSDDTIALFSNFSYFPRSNNYVTSPGMAIDVAGPGVHILSTFINSGYTTMDGTSMAAPHAAGLVALYIAANGRAYSASGVYQIRQTIVDNSLPQSQWNPLFYDDSCGCVTNITGDPDGNPEPLAFPSENWVPLPLISAATSLPGAFQMSLPAVPGYDYTVQYNSTLNGPNPWTNLGTVSGNDILTTLSVTDTNPDPVARFYQAVRSPSP